MEGGETQEDGVIVSGGSDSAAVGNVSSEGAPQDGIPMARQDSADVLGSVASLEERMSTSAARRRAQKGNMVQRVWRSMIGHKDTLPPANPDHWPTPSYEDLKSRPSRLVYVNKPQKYSFSDNFIKTSKYELWSFMPKFLAMEFHPRKKVANLYFLVVSSMQAIPAITSTFGYPILLVPLLFIVLIDMVFTIIEDASRHKADALANASQAVVLDKATGTWVMKERWEVAVGDFVKVRNREEIPADMLVVGVHERYRPNCGGVCYVETKSLDGETNLKIRQVQKVLLGRIDGHKDLESFSGRVIMEHPNKSIATFTGSLEISLRPGEGAVMTEAAGTGDDVADGGGKISSGDARGKKGSKKHSKVVKEPITPDNLLLRGTVLRNTKWATGLVLSTGHDTKVMMSIAKAPEKSSHLNSRINTEIKGLAGMLLLFCLCGAIGSTIWQSTHEVFRREVLQRTDDLATDFVVQFFYYLLLLYGFVPISLYVSQNFIRFFQAWFMDQDLDMYHEPTDTPSRVRTMNLNEDLGQITHVFSDKTGTLTQNVMDFRKCTIGGKAYGQGMTEIGQAALKLQGKELTEGEKRAEELAQSFASPHVNFYDPRMFDDLHDEVETKGGRGPVTDFMTLLALCHTVIPERPDDTDEIVLSASSPDDEALVLGAKYFGVEFAERIDTSAVLYRTKMPSPLNPVDEPVKETYDVLRILGFNSVRKRMSVIVRCPDGTVKVMAKGADTTMAPLLKEDTPKKLLETTMSQLESFALEGLRTLMVGIKELTDEEYEEWDEAYDAAINDLGEVAQQQAGQPNQIDELMARAEQGLTLLGGTAIEDKLQTGVGETIEKLIRGGMVVWVITGDKEETAINIGVACQLLWAEDRMDRCIINTKSCPTPMAVKDRLLEEFERYSQDMAACTKDGRSCKPRSLIIDGAAFALIDDGPMTSLHGPTEGEASLASLAMDSPPSQRPGLSMSRASSSRSLTATLRHGQETPSRFNASGHSTRWKRKIEVRVTGNSDSTTPAATGESNASATKTTAPGANDDSVWFGDKIPDATGVGENGGVSTSQRDGLGGGDEKQDTGDIWGLGEEKAVARDEESGWGTGTGEDVPEVIVEPGDVLTAKDALLQFAGVCQAFVGCRMSPDQKRQLVHLIKDNNPDARTLAVGDGANDVPMIQSAHVGVGISGQEGLQAVNASDYSLAQFRFLQKLLLCHGRFNYRRMSFASSYLFYKSVSWAVPLFIYAFYNGLSGQVFYDYVSSTLWALVYTGLPIILLGIYDMDVLPSTALRYPWLYRNGVDDELLTKKFFWGWIAQGVLESCWVTIPLIFLQTGGTITSGETPAVLAFGQAAFQAMTLVVNMKIVFIQRRWHWVEAVILTLSTACLFAFSWFLNASSLFIGVDWEWYGMQTALFQDPNYWAVSAFGVIGVLMRDVAWKSYHRWWHPKLHHVLVEMEKGHLKDIELPKSLRNNYSLHDVIQEDTSSRMSRMRTQSMQRIESHRDAVLQALGASQSSRAYSVTSPNWGMGASETARRLEAVVSEEGRPRSAGGRLTSLASLMEGLSKSPLLQSTQASDSKRVRSAGSSPVFPGPRASPPSGSGSLRPALVRAPFTRRKSGDFEQEMATGVARVGFAFSHDPASSNHEIDRIMRNRPPSMRRCLERHGSLPMGSRLPSADGAFQAHLRALQNHKACTDMESGGTGFDYDLCLPGSKGDTVILEADVEDFEEDDEGQKVEFDADSAAVEQKNDNEIATGIVAGSPTPIAERTVDDARDAGALVRATERTRGDKSAGTALISSADPIDNAGEAERPAATSRSDDRQAPGVTLGTVGDGASGNPSSREEGTTDGAVRGMHLDRREDHAEGPPDTKSNGNSLPNRFSTSTEATEAGDGTGPSLTSFEFDVSAPETAAGARADGGSGGIVWHRSSPSGNFVPPALYNSE